MYMYICTVVFFSFTYNFTFFPHPHTYNILVTVGQVDGGGGASQGGRPVLDGVPLDGGVVDGPRSLPRHQQAAEVVRRRLHVLGLGAADWEGTQGGGETEGGVRGGGPR